MCRPSCPPTQHVALLPPGHPLQVVASMHGEPADEQPPPSQQAQQQQQQRRRQQGAEQDRMYDALRHWDERKERALPINSRARWGVWELGRCWR